MDKKEFYFYVSFHSSYLIIYLFLALIALNSIIMISSSKYIIYENCITYIYLKKKEKNFTFKYFKIAKKEKSFEYCM